MVTRFAYFCTAPNLNTFCTQNHCWRTSRQHLVNTWPNLTFSVEDKSKASEWNPRSVERGYLREGVAAAGVCLPWARWSPRASMHEQFFELSSARKRVFFRNKEYEKIVGRDFNFLLRCYGSNANGLKLASGLKKRPQQVFVSWFSFSALRRLDSSVIRVSCKRALPLDPPVSFFQ